MRLPADFYIRKAREDSRKLWETWWLHVGKFGVKATKAAGEAARENVRTLTRPEGYGR